MNPIGMLLFLHFPFCDLKATLVWFRIVGLGFQHNVPDDFF